MSFGLFWLIFLTGIRHSCLNRGSLQYNVFFEKRMVSQLYTTVFYRDHEKYSSFWEPFF